MPNKMRRVWTMISSRNFFPRKLDMQSFCVLPFVSKSLCYLVIPLVKY